MEHDPHPDLYVVKNDAPNWPVYCLGCGEPDHGTLIGTVPAVNAALEAVALRDDHLATTPTGR